LAQTCAEALSLKQHKFGAVISMSVSHLWAFIITWNYFQLGKQAIKKFFSLVAAFFAAHKIAGGTRWRSWLRHCATSRKVADSIPVDVIGIFHCHNPSGRTMDWG
jgi:hypothetical protein